LLRLDEVETLRGIFQKIANANERDAKIQNGAKTDAGTALQKALNLPQLSSVAILAVANEKRAILSLPALLTLEANTSIKDGIVSAGVTAQPIKVAKAQEKIEVDTLLEKLNGLQAHKFLSTCSKIATAITELEKDEKFLENASRESFLQTAISYFDDESCPVCDTPWEPDV
jgi:hypothetical protein